MSKFHRNYCVPKDCETCDIKETCEERALFNTEKQCPDCDVWFTVTRLLFMSAAHDCRKYHGW